MTTTTRASRDPLAFLADELAELRRAHLYRPLRIVSSMQGPECVVDGRTVISLASNDYLGLTHHPRMIRAAAEAILDRLEMASRSVPFMPGKIIMGIFLVVIQHQPIPGHLGNNGGGSDGKA